MFNFVMTAAPSSTKCSPLWMSMGFTHIRKCFVELGPMALMISVCENQIVGV